MKLIGSLVENGRQNSWLEFWAYSKASNDERVYRRNHPKIHCLLPNGKLYNAYRLKQEPDFKSLVKKYSGKSPTAKQVKNAKEELRQQGFIVN